MSYGDRETLAQARRLLLAVATNLDDARQKLLRDVGFDIDNWYAIAYFIALDAVHLLDGMALVEVMYEKGPAGDLAQARERTIARIESMLAQALDA